MCKMFNKILIVVNLNKMYQVRGSLRIFMAVKEYTCRKIELACIFKIVRKLKRKEMKKKKKEDVEDYSLEESHKVP